MGVPWKRGLADERRVLVSPKLSPARGRGAANPEAAGLSPEQFREMQTSIVRLRDNLTEHAKAET